MPFRQLSLWLLLYGDTFIPKTGFRIFTSLNVFFLILEVWVYPFLSLKHRVSCLSLNVSLTRAKDPSTFPVSHSVGGIRRCDIPGRSVIVRQTFLAHTCNREYEWPCLIWTVLYPQWQHMKTCVVLEVTGRTEEHSAESIRSSSNRYTKVLHLERHRKQRQTGKSTWEKGRLPSTAVNKPTPRLITSTAMLRLWCAIPNLTFVFLKVAPVVR